MRFRVPKPTPDVLAKYGVKHIDPHSVNVTPVEKIRNKEIPSHLKITEDALHDRIGQRREDVHKLR